MYIFQSLSITVSLYLRGFSSARYLSVTLMTQLQPSIFKVFTIARDKRVCISNDLFWTSIHTFVCIYVFTVRATPTFIQSQDSWDQDQLYRNSLSSLRLPKFVVYEKEKHYEWESRREHACRSKNVRGSGHHINCAVWERIDRILLLNESSTMYSLWPKDMSTR